MKVVYVEMGEFQALLKKKMVTIKKREPAVFLKERVQVQVSGVGSMAIAIVEDISQGNPMSFRDFTLRFSE